MRLNAINPSFSVWVNASAGTGKTKILIDRVLRLLLENKRNILCLTFTNAAANEMESRIHSTLSKWAICSESVLAADLEQLGLSLMSSQSPSFCHPSSTTLGSRENEGQARRLFSELENLGLTIQTIHAFCYKLISSFPVEAGIVPNCTLSECKELHSFVFDKTLHNETVQDDINLIAAEVDENKLRDLLYTLCVKRPLSADDLEYVKDKLSAPDEIHGLQSDTIEHVERLAEILSEGSKRDQSYSTMLYDWCKPSVIPVRDAGIQKKRNMDPSVSCLDDTNIENLTKVFLKSESNEKKKHIIYHNKGCFGKIQRCRTNHRKYSKCSIYSCERCEFLSNIQENQ
jgi:ATP-dependent helicase/nuclease subunit A